jgi:hypothetical protein
MNLPLEVYRAWIAARVAAGEEQQVTARIELLRSHKCLLWPGIDQSPGWQQEAFADWLEAELKRQTE